MQSKKSSVFERYARLILTEIRSDYYSGVPAKGGL